MALDDNTRDRFRRRIATAANVFIDKVFEAGENAGYLAAKEKPIDDAPRCRCDDWTTSGRLLGVIRATPHRGEGWCLVGWRTGVTGERLEEPIPQNVHEVPFSWCPFCGSRVPRGQSS
jgi:hypothetical protein